MQSEPVRAALHAKAVAIAAEVDAVAATDEDEDTYDRVATSDVFVEDGTRPRGRPFSAVHITREDGYTHEVNAQALTEAEREGKADQFEEREPYVDGKRRVLATLAARHNAPRTPTGGGEE